MTCGRILIVEDNPANLALMSYLLRAFGYTVVSARDGEEGVEAARRERPDLVLMDIQMPKLSGFEAASRMREIDDLRTVPLVAVTAFAMVGDRERVLAGGFDGYLPKPINPETFVAEVEVFLAPTRRASRPSLRS
jgi:CheY-like chemotaxis protein